MKIAFIANTSWNIYNFRKGLVHHFLTKGCDIIVLTPRDEYTHSIIGWGVKWIETPLDGTGINPFKDFKYLTNLKKTFKEEKPDVAFSYTIKCNIYACFASKRTLVPIICNVSGLGTVFMVEDLVGKLAINLYRIAFKNARFVFFQNRDDKDLFLSKVRFPEEKIGLLPGSGINLNEYKYSAPEFKKTTKFLMISRLIIEKGVKEFAEAALNFANNDEVSFTLVGRFDESHSRSIDKAEFHRWVQSDWIHYLPHSDKIKELIKEHEVVVLPSHREGTPRTLLEGAAMGRALLASDVPGCKEIVEEGVNGFLFEAKNVEHLTKKVKRYLSLSLDERKKLSENSRRLAEMKFDENLVAKAYEETVRQINVSS
ncbi:MAG: glycosyltransferase family 4 protein [Bacteroidota bacterium]